MLRITPAHSSGSIFGRQVTGAPFLVLLRIRCRCIFLVVVSSSRPYSYVLIMMELLLTDYSTWRFKIACARNLRCLVVCGC